MARSEAFSAAQRERLERALAAAEEQTGLRFSLRVGPVESEPRLQAERLLAHIADSPRDAVVLLMVAPGERRVEVMTTPAARRRITDHAAGLAVLSMTSTFAVGDLVGGIVSGIRQLADAAGRAGGVQGAPELAQGRVSGRAPMGAGQSETVTSTGRRALDAGPDTPGSDHAGQAARDPDRNDLADGGRFVEHDDGEGAGVAAGGIRKRT